MIKKAVLLMLVILLAGLLVVGCGGNKQTSEPVKQEEVKTITLKYAFFAPPSTFPAVQMEKWKEEVEKRTNGRVKVETYPGGTLLGAMNMYEGVSQGVAEIGLTCPSYFPGQFPLFAISDMAIVYPNAKVASLVLYDLIQEFQPPSLKDYKVITVFATEPSYIMSMDRIASLEDLKGKEIRISGGNAAVLGALGAAPVGMGMGQVSEALQTGVIRGNVSSREVLKDFKFIEKTKYVVDYPLTTTSFAALMDRDVWDSLPADVQKVIDEVSREMALFAGTYLDDYVQDVIEWGQKEQGLEVITLSAEERAKWDAIVMPFAEQAAADAEAKGLPGNQFLKRLLELNEQHSKQYK
ncbi:MAG: TRAP transporter substrate-binding protein [Clostridia bacterium]|nr:TRAP transporter substrate-binding protein [Clostridia bacterium]